VHRAGDRRDHFETELDPWELMRVIVRERKERELDPTLAFLRDCAGSRELGREDPATQKRLRETLVVMEALSAWADQVGGMDGAGLRRLAKLGGRLQAFIRAS
jgi:DNA-binding transcriptional regulator GbsR (MarR family)